MKVLNKLLTNKTIDYQKLQGYGFNLIKDSYVYEKILSNNHFKVIIEINKDKQISKVIDLDVDDEYILVDVPGASGNYVGKIREEYNAIINDFINKCTKYNIFKETQTKEIIEYIKNKYHDDLEYLWEKTPDAAIWRNKDNSKWYGLLMKIPENRLDTESNNLVEIIDLRYPKDNIMDILKKKGIYPGYHMNKKSWITIILDNSVDTDEIYKLIDLSYEISMQK